MSTLSGTMRDVYARLSRVAGRTTVKTPGFVAELIQYEVVALAPQFGNDLQVIVLLKCGVFWFRHGRITLAEMLSTT